MNLVLDDAEELNAKTNERKTLGTTPDTRFAWHWADSGAGRILLKGDNITLIRTVPTPAS